MRKTMEGYACSMGAYFSLMSYQDEKLKQCLFLSPLLDMKRVIENMMISFHITEQRLKKERIIKTPAGMMMYWDYYCYVKAHPVDKWHTATAILRGQKDTLCEEDTILDFVKRFHAQLEIRKEAEHYFHTPEDLETFRKWAQTHILLAE